MTSVPRPECRPEAYVRDGVHLVPELFGTAEVRSLRDFAEELLVAPEHERGPWRYTDDRCAAAGRTTLVHRVERFADFDHPGARALRSPRLHAIVEACLGMPASPFKEKLNYKPRGGSGFEAHQDLQAGWGAYADTFVNVAIALDPSTPETGCLEIARGRHREGLLGPMWCPIVKSVEDTLAFEPVAMLPGDALFFDAMVPHRSGPNVGAPWRRMLILTFSPGTGTDASARYHADKFAAHPPDFARPPGATSRYRV
ncbi:MAG: phytanoyl-CoA dioxygenase family protein [Polyangiaceae bacterium]